MQVFFKTRHECWRKRQTEDILFAVFARNLELFATKGDAPLALRIFVEVLTELHFTHVPLTIGNIGPQLEHEREPSTRGIVRARTITRVFSNLVRLFGWPESTANVLQGCKGHPSIVFVVRRAWALGGSSAVRTGEPGGRGEGGTVE